MYRRLLIVAIYFTCKDILFYFLDSVQLATYARFLRRLRQPLLKNKPDRKIKASVEYHLLVFLQKIGSEGIEGNSDKIATFMGCGKGLVKTMVKQVRNAILKLKEKVIVWPDAEEKE